VGGESRSWGEEWCRASLLNMPKKNALRKAKEGRKRKGARKEPTYKRDKKKTTNRKRIPEKL